METEESSAGYPEEAPPGADPGGGPGTPQRDGADVPRKHDDGAEESDDGQATGNPPADG